MYMSIIVIWMSKMYTHLLALSIMLTLCVIIKKKIKKKIKEKMLALCEHSGLIFATNANCSE